MGIQDRDYVRDNKLNYRSAEKWNAPRRPLNFNDTQTKQPNPWGWVLIGLTAACGIVWACVHFV